MISTKSFTVLSYIEHCYFSLCGTGCILTYTFDSLFLIPIGITNTAVELKICTITAGIKKYKSIIKENKQKRNTMVWLPIL